MKTFGDYEERCNVANSRLVFRCGICDAAFNTAKAREQHHFEAKEKKYVYHTPIQTAGSLSYLVDAAGYRVNDRGRRI